jgi:hypothetical protein
MRTSTCTAASWRPAAPAVDLDSAAAYAKRGSYLCGRRSYTDTGGAHFSSALSGRTTGALSPGAVLQL